MNANITNNTQTFTAQRVKDNTNMNLTTQNIYIY